MNRTLDTNEESSATAALWDATDVARYLKVSRSWVYHRAESGELPCLKVGGLLRFDPQAIHALREGFRRTERAWYLLGGSRMRNRFGIRRGEPLAEVLSRLVARDPGWTPKPKLADDHVLLVALETLGEMGDERAAPYLVMPLVMGDAVDTTVAARVLERLMPRDLAGLALLEGKVRDRGWYGYDTWWPDRRPPLQTYVEEASARTVLERGLSTAAIGLLSMNANGRTRELATRALAGVTDGSELPFLMLRANDWVNEVSGIARRAIKRRCMPENAPGFVAVLPFVERLKVQRRVDKTDLVHQIEAMLVGSAAGLDALEAAMRGAQDATVRRSVARLARSRNFPLSRVESAISDRDALVRTQFAMAAAERATQEEQARWLPQLFEDKSPRIRSIAFRAAESQLPAVLGGALRRFLLDSNFWLREFARQKLSQHGPVDFANEYRLAIEQGKAANLRAAITGLSEVGEVSDVRHVLPYLSRGSSQVRQAALRALCFLVKQDATPHLLSGIASELAGVSKTASELLRSRNLAVTAAEIAPLFKSALPHVRANALAVLAANDRWEALIAALERLSDPEERVLEVARSIVGLWRHFPPTLYSRPSVEQRGRLSAALKSVPPGTANVSKLVHTIAENG